MKKVLITSATAMETEWLRAWLDSEPLKHTETDILITGVGMVATALSLGEYLSVSRPDFAIMTGIAGTFSDDLSIGEVVEIQEECLPELGAESPEGFLGLEAMGFPMLQLHDKKIYNKLRNEQSWFQHLPQVRGITVNTVSGITETILARKIGWEAEVESMEGAAFFLAMIKHEIPFVEIRGISNRVEPRNPAAWDIKGASQAAQKEVWNFLQTGGDFFET